MTHSSNLLDRLSPGLTPCPLLRIGHNNSSTDETNVFRYQHRSSEESDCLNYYDQPHSYLSEDPTYDRSHSKYAKGSIDLSSLCLGPSYWETKDSTRESQYYLSQNQSNDSSFLFDNFAKIGKSSPSLDQGYATLVTPAASSNASIWNDRYIYKGKRLHPKNNSFDKLSDELVLRIFSFLTSIDLSICAQVCRRFDTLVWTPCLWRVITLDQENVNGDKAIKGVLRQLCGQDRTGACPCVEKIHVTNGAKISDRSLLLLAKRCPELSDLQLHGCTNITNNALFEIATRCTNLQHLDVTGCVKISCISINSISDANRRMQLQYLDLTDCVIVQDGGLRIIVQNCPQLAYLYLRRCVQITDAGLKYVPSFCSGLRELSVSDCSNVTDFGLYELAKLGPTLRYLSVAKCDQVSDAGLKVIARKCYKLRYLNARGCEAVSDDAITVLARFCTRLRALDIGKCDVSDAGLRALAECCPNLKKLSLRNCELVTDRGVQCVAYYCRGLQQLNIQDCQISLEGYRAVKKYCKRCVIEHTNPGFF
ncbi:hypothetical protein ABEB36_011416 [Hypothenemus hampei]|uniref:F-box domain-containing protein n=1 Tax=Hypothenemus hampei TaxID=57062 RepID=A0ABD1EFC1_HYPHA